MASSSSSKTSPQKKKSNKDDLLFQPTELSQDEYKSLLEQVRNDLSVQDCQEELLDAARYNDVDVVRAILQVHPNLPPLPVDDKRGGGNGNTPLHMAAANGHTAIMEILLATPACCCGCVNAKNKAGNTPLHWASQNGHDAAVQLLLQHDKKADVLQQNAFGRSALTEGFTSQNTNVVKSLLEHDSATEEKLMQTPPSGVKGAVKTQVEQQSDDDDDDDNDGVTHEFIFQDATTLQVRELPMARGDDDTILGQVNPSDDTTGLGIWAASLVTAQWMAHLCSKEENKFSFCGSSTATDSSSDSSTTTPTRVLELGAGCGVPAVTIAKMAASSNNVRVYATDFNPKTVENLQYNMELNDCCRPSSTSTEDDNDKDDDSNNDTTGNNATAMIMNWQDKSTWPEEKMDFVIGSDLIYQSDMVPLLVQTIQGLLKKNTGTFLYCAPETGRQGQDDFFTRMSKDFTCVERPAPASYLSNPLQSQDDDLCFLHFNELQSSSFKLYEFTWKK